MEIKFHKKEVEALVRDHVIEAFGIDITGMDVDVSGSSYDGVTVSVTKSEVDVEHNDIRLQDWILRLART